MNERIVFGLNKLVRDKLPDMMREVDQEPEVVTLAGIDKVRALIAKVAEEVAELDPESSSYTKELSQVKQALMDLIESSSDPEVIEELRLGDLERRGGFLDGQYITTLSLSPDDEWVEYYRREPEKYPEVEPQ